MKKLVQFFEKKLRVLAFLPALRQLRQTGSWQREIKNKGSDPSPCPAKIPTQERGA